MWEQINPHLPPELASCTSSVWTMPGIGTVGVMRISYLSPPALWFHFTRSSLALLRKANFFLDALQEQLYAPIVVAEALHSEPTSIAFLRFLNFSEIGQNQHRILYTRRL